MLSRSAPIPLSRLATRALSTAHTLPLNPPTLQEEDAAFKKRTAQVNEFFNQERFKSLKRPYSAESIATKQGNLPALPLPGSLLADKLHALLTKAEEQKKPVHTMGAIDPVQVTQMARHQEVVYVSGWAASSVLTTANNEVGPDLA
jgi:isocitrate lyase